jgi:transcription initiation factor TFIID subunit 2
MTAIFSIETTAGVLPQHIGIVIGPFQHVDLSEYRDTSEDDRLQDEAIKVHAFCLPGREDEVRNSAMMIARTLDSFTDRYQTYRFGKSYKMAFVDDLDCDTAHTMSMTICSSRLLFPETVWEPLEHTTRVLVHAVASQWIGVDVIAQTPRDHWAIVGGSWFMTEFYLRDLFGRNDHRFRQKLIMDKIVQMDVRRPCLYDLGEYLQLDPGEQEFMELKSLSVLSILHNRLVKASGKNGVDRCLYRLLFNHGNGSLLNGAISTDAFMSICEKVGHQKLDNFFRQWIYGAGCPTFDCAPSFNKKKQVVTLTIKQSQSDPAVLLDDRSLASSEFMREAKERSRGFYPDGDWPAFVGPMTIRIHEADGTPYEHIVNINSSQVRVEIPYNTKYKRLKRNRLQKERQAAAQGVTLDASGEQQEDVTFYSLGDLFMTPEEAQEWRIQDWGPNEEQQMEGAAYEWIRIDADFEWISKINISDMPSFMYISQLQQDKDVVAQAETIQYLARKVGSGLLASFLVKTLMDNRYFHGIRTMAADLLVNCATEDADRVGLFHLKKAFQELFCLPNSTMTRPNNFSDRALYLIQCAIPKAIARIKGPDGKAPMEVKTFLLDLMRYNENRGNDYSDDHYLAILMRCLTESITSSKPHAASADPTQDLLAEAEEYEFRKKAIDELERHLRLDEWIPTYQNIYTRTVLDCEVKLIKNRVNPLKVSDFLQYTQIGNADNVRLKAWECLVQLGIFKMKDSVVKYFIHNIHADPSPYFRSQMLRIFDHAVGQVAVGEVFALDEPDEKDGVAVVEEEGISNRAAELARRKLDGALQGLRADLENSETLKKSIEEALKSKTMSVSDVSELLDFTSLVITPIDELKIRLEYPWYYKVERVSGAEHQLLMRFRRTHVRTESTHPRLQPTIPPPDPVETATAPPQPAVPPTSKIKLTIKRKLEEPVAGPPATGMPSPAPVPAPALSQTTARAESADRLNSLAGQGGLLKPNVLKSPTPPVPVAPPVVTLLDPLPESTPPSAQVPPPDSSIPLEGIEITPVLSPTPDLSPPPEMPEHDITPKPIEKPKPVQKEKLVELPKPVPAASPAPQPTPKATLVQPTPKIKLKNTGPKAASTAKVPKQSKGKKSRIVKLYLSPEKLATVVDGSAPSKKRKADTIAVGQRPSKRQSIDPSQKLAGASAVNGVGGGEAKGALKKARVEIERTGGERPRLLLKFWSNRLPIE